MWSIGSTRGDIRYSHEKNEMTATNFVIRMVYYLTYPFRTGGLQDEVPILWI